MISPSLPACSLQMVVEPSEQDLVGRQTKKIVDCLNLLTEPVLGMKFDVDLGKETSAGDPGVRCSPPC